MFGSSEGANQALMAENDSRVDRTATGARFTAVGVVTPDPASVASVLAWANRLQERAQYLIVQNATSPQADFSYWESAEQAIRFREALSPIVIRMDFRLAELENPARQYGVRLGQVATRQNARGLEQSCSEMNSVQKQLANVLREVAHPDIGVIAKVRSANDSLLRSMIARAQQIDDLLGRLKKQVWAVWLPVVGSAALALGFALGTWFANERQVARETPGNVQSQQGLAAPVVLPETVPQRGVKHH